MKSHLISNKSKLFNYVLKFILPKTLNGNPGPVLEELEKVFFKRWVAVENRDDKTAESLESKESKLVNQLLEMGAKKD